MVNSVFYIRNFFVCFLLFSCFTGFSQSGIQDVELIIPEGIKKGLLAIEKNRQQTQLILSEDDNNKIIVWDLIRNKQKYNVVLPSTIRSVAYNESGKYIYVSTNNVVYILDSENGNIISKRTGSNYVNNNFSPFVGNQYLYINENQLYIADIFSEQDQKIEISDENFHLINANYNTENRLFFLFSGHSDILIYDKDLNFYSKLSLAEYYNELYTLNNNLITFNDLGSSVVFKTYDLKSEKLKNEITIKEDGTFRSFHDKSKQYIDYNLDKIFLYQNNSIVIKDIITGKTIKSIPLKINEIYDIVLSEDKKSLLVYGIKPGVYNEREILVYDVVNYTLKNFNTPVKNQDNWTDMVQFDDENFFIYRFTENQILKNSIQTGELKSSYLIDKNKTISNYPTEPVIIDNKYILAILEDNENYKKSIVCIDVQTNRLLWTFDRIENSFFGLEINTEQQILSITDENYPNNHYFILDIATGKTLFHETSEERLQIYPISKNKIFKLSSFQGGDWKNPVYELHISEFSVPENKTTLHKISMKSGGYINDVLQKEQQLYLKYNNKLFSFSTENLSKITDSINVDMQDCKLIAIHDNEFLYSYSLKEKKIFKAYNLKSEKEIPFQEGLSFVDYNKALQQILLKSNTNDLYLFDIITQELFQTSVNLSKTKNIKILHDKWLVYKTEKTEAIYDLENKRIKHNLDEFSEVKSLSKDGNLYYNYGKIKYSKNGSYFVGLANEVAIPSSVSNLSFGFNPNEIIYFDENELLCFLNLAENTIRSFQLFSPSSYELKYKKLSQNLFLVSRDSGSLNREYKILDTNSQKTTNLSENTLEINDFEVNNELLFVKENDQLKIYNFNNAEQLFETKSYNHKQLNDALVIFDDSKTINLYSTKTDKILWKNNIPRKNYMSYFSNISDNTVFVINEDILYALDIKNGNIKSSYTLPSKVTLFYSEPLYIHPQDKKIIINIGNDFKSDYIALEYKNNQFITSDINNLKNIDIPKLKEDYKIDEDDNFSLNKNILVIYKYQTNKLSVYDTDSNTKILEQEIGINNLGLTWDVTEPEKTIFIYNNSGEILFVNYENKETIHYKINGNKFKIYNNRLFVSDYGKKIDVYEFEDIKNVTKMYSFVPLPNKEYMFYTNQGYYLSTKEAAKNLQFRLNENLHTFEQFDLIYNRPDLVLKAMKSTNSDLIKIYETAYQKRLKRQNYTLTTSLELAPVVSIFRKNPLQKTNESTLELEINANGKEDKISKIIIKVNDNQYKEISVETKTYNSTEKIILNSGNNSIEVYALNSKNIKGISEKLEVFYKDEKTKSPKVYFFGIGVSDYKNQNFNLKYASKDIKDMATILSERYSDIDINLLLDNDVTIENINKFKQKLAQTQTNDIVIISFCGHGILDKDYNWYFATHDLDFDNPKKRGFSYDDLTELTNNISSRQKLVTLDACHSGEIDTAEISDEKQDINHQQKENTEGKIVATKRGSIAIKTTKDGGKSSFVLMKQMFSELESSNGTIIISASGGMEYAFEGGNYKNGVFTYSILDLLYNSVWNTLKISELQKTVMENVYKLTDGKQQPNVRTGTLNYDWVVW